MFDYVFGFFSFFQNKLWKKVLLHTILVTQNGPFWSGMSNSTVCVFARTHVRACVCASKIALTEAETQSLSSTDDFLP